MVVAGFIVFFILEKLLYWHHCHKPIIRHKPVSYLILIADGIHNFIEGLSIGAAFVIDIKLGIITWIIVAIHEISQELGDFGILIHSGWHKTTALFFNLLSASTFLVGAILAYVISAKINVAILLAFGGGNLLYIGAADLIPLIRSNRLLDQIIQIIVFVFGIWIMFILAS